MNKWRNAIWVGLSLLLLAAGSLGWRLSVRREEPVVLRLKGYHWVARQNWCYAQLELINRSTNQVKYPVFQNDDFGLSPTFSRESRLGTWAPTGIPQSAPSSVCVMHTLEPGQTATLKVHVTPGTTKRFAGVLLTDVPVRNRSSLELWLRRVLQPVSRSLGIPLAPPESLAFRDHLISSDRRMNPPPKPVEDHSGPM